jgi:hypothetical protein
VCDGLFSNLEIVFCVFPAENNFVKVLIPFIGVTSPSNLNVSITREEKMDQKTDLDKDKIIPERMEVLRSLPVEIKQLLTGEEAQAFLYGEELPEDLAEKLKDYLIQE